jgi:hypothetical protein
LYTCFFPFNTEPTQINRQMKLLRVTLVEQVTTFLHERLRV